MINPQTKQTRVAVYLRVSTDEQAKEGRYGLEVQEEGCRTFCRLKGYSLNESHVFQDDISGGLPIEKRPALNLLFEAVKRKEFDTVLVYKTDRLARNVRILLNAINDFEKFSVGFQSVTEPFDTTTAAGRVNMNLLATFAEFEKEQIRERTMNGKLRGAMSGKWMTGVPPYGYRVVKKTKALEVVPEEAKIVKQLFQWITDEKLPLREIEKRMNEKKIPTPHSTRTKMSRGNYWYRRTIGRILTNEVYTGEFYYRKYRRPFNNLTSITNTDKLRPRDEWVLIPVPPIISKELFESSKNQLLENRNFSKRNQKRDYLYSKLAHCGTCGYKMFSGYQPPRANIEKSESTGKYYHGVYRKSDEVGTTRRCDMCKQYAESRMEPIWECLKEVLKNPKNMLNPLKQYAFKEDDPQNTKTRLSEIEKELSTLQQKRERMEDLFINGDDINKERLNQYSTEFKRDENRLHDEMSRLKQKLLSREEKEDRQKVIERLYEKVKTRIENVAYTEKSKIIQLFIERITLYPEDDRAEVVFKFPETANVSLSPETKKVSQGSEGVIFPLVLNIKTISERQRRIDIIQMNPLMYTPRMLA